MASEFLKSLDFETLSPTRLWMAMSRDDRKIAAVAFYGEDPDRNIQASIDQSIAGAISFRVPTVRKLPIEKKIEYLTSRVRPDHAIASMLLQAFHLTHNQPLLVAFLDSLEIAHEEGHIKDDNEFDPPTEEKLVPASDKLYKDHDEARVDSYLVALNTLEPELWAGLRPVLEKRLA